MENVSDFDIASVPVWKIVFAATSLPDYEMDRVLLLERYPDYGSWALVAGNHCSCYDFDGSRWDATIYNTEELRAVVQGWLATGSGIERIIAPLILEYVGKES